MTNQTQLRPADSRQERRNRGKALRQQVPRSSHGAWAPPRDRPDPLKLLQAQDAGRLLHLLPIKYGRMVASPFAFLRGSAVVMAADLAETPTTGIQTILCGDAHLSNFGLFASPERKLLFDINDFDEVYPGPWEWDLKRLATSAVVAGRENGLAEKTCRDMAKVVAQTYQAAMKRFSQVSTLDMWYYHIDAEAVLRVFEKAASKRDQKQAAKMVSKAHTRTQEQTLEKLTYVEGGRRQIISDPPLLVPFREDSITRIFGAEAVALFTPEFVENSWLQYLASLAEERRMLLQRYRLADMALRVGGVGSVGTRCSILLLEGGAEDDAIIVQIKEAGPSVLESYLPKRSYRQHAERVVIGQRLMQATSDIFLGWHTSEASEFDYYWRQLKDMKGSIDVAVLDEDGFRSYLALCSWCLARAHARTGDAATVYGYLGGGKAFARAITDFAVAYADQTERDHQALVDAVREGRIIAETGI